MSVLAILIATGRRRHEWRTVLEAASLPIGHDRQANRADDKKHGGDQQAAPNPCGRCHVGSMFRLLTSVNDTRDALDRHLRDTPAWPTLPALGLLAGLMSHTGPVPDCDNSMNPEIDVHFQFC